MMLKPLQRALRIAALLGLVATGASAQTKPDFSGTWILVTDAVPSAAPSLLSAMWTSPFVLTHHAGTISVRSGGVTTGEQYLLDDTDHRVNPTDVVRAGWKENTIVLRVTHSTESVPTILTQSLTLDGDRLLIVFVSARGTRQLPPVKVSYVRDQGALQTGLGGAP